MATWNEHDGGILGRDSPRFIHMGAAIIYGVVVGIDEDNEECSGPRIPSSARCKFSGQGLDDPADVASMHFTTCVSDSELRGPR